MQFLHDTFSSAVRTSAEPRWLSALEPILEHC